MAKTKPVTNPAVDDVGDDLEGKTAQTQLDTQHKLVAYALAVGPLGTLPPRPHEGLLFSVGEGGTENYRIEGKALGYEWCLAALGPNHPDTRFWRKELLTYMRGEHHQFMGAEQCCDGAHHGMHAAGHAVPRLFAATYNDVEVFDETTWWWSHYLRIAQECSTPSGEVIVPGCNVRTREPHQKLWSSVWRHYTGLADYEGPTEKKLTKDRFWTAYWAITRTICKLNDVPVAKSLPRMRCPMSVKRTDNGYTARIDPPAPGDGTVAWKWVCSQVEVAGEQLVGVKRAFEQ